METIANSRIVPVQEDLTLEDLRLSIQRGLEKMFRVDKKYAPGVTLELGEWGVLQNDGTVARPGATPVAETYLVFCGTERFDARATGQVTLLMNSNLIVKSSRFEPDSYAVGMALCVKNLGADAAHVSPASAGEFVCGKVLEVGNGCLVYEVFASQFKMA